MLRNKTKNRIIKQLESIPFEEIRSKILHCDLGFDEGSLSQIFCLSWLKKKESELRDKRSSLTLRIAIYANIIAIIGIIYSNQDKIFEIIFSIINLR